MMPKAILKPAGPKWIVVIIDVDLEGIYTEPLPLPEAQRIADEYNQRTVMLHMALAAARKKFEVGHYFSLN
jgi:hypothetical protein